MYIGDNFCKTMSNRRWFPFSLEFAVKWPINNIKLYMAAGLDNNDRDERRTFGRTEFAPMLVNPLNMNQTHYTTITETVLHVNWTSVNL